MGGAAVAEQRRKRRPRDDRTDDMSVERWLASAVADVRARGLEGAVPVLEAFARGMTTLRAADWNTSPAHPASAGVDRWRPVVGLTGSGGRGGRYARHRRAGPPPPLASDDLHTLDIAPASERIRAADVDLAGADRELPSANRTLNRPSSTRSSPSPATKRWRQRGRPTREIARGEWRGPLHGIPISLKDLIDQRGVVTTAGSRVPDADRGCAGCTGHRRAAASRRRAHRQDESSRVRVRHDQRRVRIRPGPPSAGSRAVTRRVQRRVGGCGGHRHVARVDRHGHRRIDQDSRGCVRPRGAEARFRRALVQRGRAAERHARSRRPARTHRDGRGDRLRRARGRTAADAGAQARARVAHRCAARLLRRSAGGRRAPGGGRTCSSDCATPAPR